MAESSILLRDMGISRTRHEGVSTVKDMYAHTERPDTKQMLEHIKHNETLISKISPDAML